MAVFDDFDDARGVNGLRRAARGAHICETHLSDHNFITVISHEHCGLQITGKSSIYSTAYSADNKANIKAPIRLSFWEAYTSDW